MPLAAAWSFCNIFTICRSFQEHLHMYTTVITNSGQAARELCFMAWLIRNLFLADWESMSLQQHWSFYWWLVPFDSMLRSMHFVNVKRASILLLWSIQLRVCHIHTNLRAHVPFLAGKTSHTVYSWGLNLLACGSEMAHSPPLPQLDVKKDINNIYLVNVFIHEEAEFLMRTEKVQVWRRPVRSIVKNKQKQKNKQKMSFSKRKRKLNNENRQFQERWTLQYFLLSLVGMHSALYCIWGETRHSWGK